MEDELRIGPFRLRLQEKPMPLFIPKNESDYRSLTPASEFDLAGTPHTDLAQQGRNFHTPWPEDVEQAKLLEDLMDQFQNMQGPMFTEHQHVLSTMIESFSQLNGDQTEAMKKELERLRSISQGVVAKQQNKVLLADPETMVSPDPNSFAADTEAPKVPPQKVAGPLPASTPSAPQAPARPATSLLETSDSSVFRIPIKTGTH